MSRILVIVFTISFLLSACGTEKGIEVHEAWMRPAVQGENGAVYFVIHNHSSKADELLSVSSEVAEAVEMHKSSLSGDVMEMQQLESIPLEAFAEIKFAPGSLHLMLVALKSNFTVGDQIEVTLHFKNFEDLKVTVPVRDTAAPEEDHSTNNH